MPLTDSAVRMDGVESPTQWLASHQLHNTTDASGQHSSRRWYDTHAGVREDVLTQDSHRRRASIEQWPRHIQHSEAEVQALLDRPRRIKTTAENARFHCNESAMSAVYTYTCENTSASYVGLCLQERIRLLGTSKAAAQNEQEWIANDSKIRWLQRSWISMPTYADADL
ncbi:hypothetical protein KCU79_g18016, partial [Aureobasidium melanogenum]